MYVMYVCMYVCMALTPALNTSQIYPCYPLNLDPNPNAPPPPTTQRPPHPTCKSPQDFITTWPQHLGLFCVSSSGRSKIKLS